ncbi:universal stress protein [Desulfoscipio gibsoniae]|uniref:Universal stress protein UspA-like protein n=1 Tax=Desulfoscipio gibsoniae DSM 7213 TaxID=767817 RepID=R4KT16_9FIRM|nr:universal stress protein [Desulfoscipio gibsoniae]AGL02741.1 universal stress protein UspA-like protein [Desulfoscipio gibsoniae DSM 7213]
MNVLVPVDGSDNAMRAVIYAVFLAKENPNTQVTILSAIPPFTETRAGMALEKARHAFVDAGLTVDAALVEGEPADTIIKYAQEHNMDNIIIGHRGMGALKSMVLGSVSQKVLSKSNKPVTIIK